MSSITVSICRVFNTSIKCWRKKFGDTLFNLLTAKFSSMPIFLVIWYMKTLINMQMTVPIKSYLFDYIYAKWYFKSVFSKLI